MFGFLGAGFNPGVFEAHYRAMPLAFTQNKQSAEYGDKVILPPSALDRLAAMHIEYPMLFKVESAQTGRTTHCGVLEFVADEGVVYMPHWMMQNLLLEVGNMVKFRNVSLPKGTYVKLQPVTSDFLDITNPKAVLERTLRGYTCLTVGDCFVVNYNNKNYEIEVRDAKPANAISVVETDCQVDFEAPKDYKEPERVPPPPPPASKPEPMQEDGKGAGPSTSAAEPAAEEEPTFLAFAGTSRRLDGKTPTNPEAPKPIPLAQVSAYAAAQKRAAEAAAAASAPQPSSSAGAGGSGAGGRKAGTFVGFTPTGNRLLDKLAREKAAAGNPGGAPPPPPPPDKEEKKEEGSNFKPFAGKGYSLK